MNIAKNQTRVKWSNKELDFFEKELRKYVNEDTKPWSKMTKVENEEGKKILESRDSSSLRVKYESIRNTRIKKGEELGVFERWNGKVKELKRKVDDKLEETIRKKKTEWGDEENVKLESALIMMLSKNKQIYDWKFLVEQTEKTQPQLKSHIRAIQFDRLKKDKDLGVYSLGIPGDYYPEKKIKQLGIECPSCQSFINSSDLLLQGLKCGCGITTQELSRALTKFMWVTYIIQASGKTLTEEVKYVGVSINAKSRIDKHFSEISGWVEEGYFVRISLVLGETQLIKMLTPTKNIQKSAGKKESNQVRLLNPNTLEYEEKDLGSLIFSGYSRDFKENSSQFDHISSNSSGIISGIIRPLKMDEDFCYSNILKSKEETSACQHKPECNYKRLHNRFLGKDLFDGINLSDAQKHYLAIKNVSEGHKYNLQKDNSIKVSKSLEFFQEVVSRNKAIAESSANKYKKDMEKLFKNGWEDYLDEPLTLWRYMSSALSLSTSVGFLGVLKVFFRNLPLEEGNLLFGFDCHGNSRYRYVWEGINLLHETKKKEYDELLSSNEKNEREKLNWASMEELQGVLVQLSNDISDIRSLQKFVAYNLQLLCSVRNDNGSIKISNIDNNSDNFLDISSWTLNYQQYKTSKTYDTVKLEIPNESEYFGGLGLREKLQELYDHRLKSGAEYLFLQSDGNPYNSKSYGVFLTSISDAYIKRKIGSSMIRKIIVSDFRKNERTPKESKEFARKMLHSETTERNIYRKI